MFEFRVRKETAYMPNEIKWNTRFCIGVDTIDQAHERLFTIVGKLISLNEDELKQQHACREGVKYFKSYAMKHFAAEEAYMKSINYAGYAIHKDLHDNMRDETLPALENELEKQNYSRESVRHFVGICLGWLNAHIMIEDYAITGKSASKWMQQATVDETDALIKTFLHSLEAMCHSQAHIVSQRYGGEDFASGQTLCYRLTYISKDKDRPQFYFAYEESFVLKTLGAILGQDFPKIDQTATAAMKILSEQFVGTLKGHFMRGKKFYLERDDLMTFDQFVRTFDKTYPPYSLLFSTEGQGYCAFCAQCQIN